MREIIVTKDELKQEGETGFFRQYANNSETTLTLFEEKVARSDVIYDIFDAAFLADCNLTEVFAADYAVMLSLTAPAEIELSAVIVDRDTGAVVCTLPGVETQGQHTVELADHIVLDPSLRGKNLSLIASADYLMQGRAGQSVHAVAPLRERAGGLRYTHERPVKKQPGARPEIFGSPELPWRPVVPRENDADHVVVALARVPTDEKDVDYICGFGRDRTAHPYFAVPGSGLIAGPTNAKFLPDAPETGGHLVLYPRRAAGGGGVLAASSGRRTAWGGEKAAGIATFLERTKTGLKETQFHTDPGDFTFRRGNVQQDACYEALGAWQNHSLIFDRAPDIRQCYDYELRLWLAYELADGAVVPYTVVITSFLEKPYDADQVFRVVKPVVVCYGCLAEGVLVTMADGSRRKVEQVRMGEWVRAGDAIAQVENIWKGGEEGSLVSLCWAGGSVLVTQDHPVSTPSGFRRADALRPGDQVVTEHGQVVLTEASEMPFNGTVYNLDVKTHRFYANGLEVGDMGRQNRL